MAELVTSSAPSVETMLISCIRAWFSGSVATAVVIAISVFVMEAASEEYLALLIALPSAWFLASIISLPFMAFVAAPLAFVVVRLFSDNLALNTLIGASLGAAVAIPLQSLVFGDLVSGFSPLSVIVGAIYGAATGYQLTRTLYV